MRLTKAGHRNDAGIWQQKADRIKLLDCTVRDGGYINDWEFGKDRLNSIFERLTDSGVDIVEIGFLDERRPFDANRSIGPDTKSLKKIWGSVSKRPPMVTGMIDYGTCAAENIEPAEDSFLDGIRVIFKKQRMQEAMDFCAHLKLLGYKVFAQLVSITSYEEEDLADAVRLVNEVKPYAVSIVDTYGLLMPQRLLYYAEFLDAGVDCEVKLGFHAHNNLQMGFANALAFLGLHTDRGLLVDGTLYGMGKSAGNAPLELLAMHMNESYGRHYRIQPMLEAIEHSILPVYRKSPWGYQKFYFMAAKEKCHPNYLEYYQKKSSLSPSDMDELLKRTEPQEKKLFYDETLAEQIYQEYIKEKYDDNFSYDGMARAFQGKEILLIGPGKNISLQSEKVIKYMEQTDPVRISINYIPDGLKPDYVFVTKGSRYEEMTVPLQNHPDIKIIATSNLTAGNRKFEYIVMREPLLEEKGPFEDNPFLMFLKVLKQSGVCRIACAGFDGYSQMEDNYVIPSMEYDFVKGAAQLLNRHIQTILNQKYADMSIDFVTYSHYQDEEDSCFAAF